MKVAGATRHGPEPIVPPYPTMDARRDTDGCLKLVSLERGFRGTVLYHSAFESEKGVLRGVRADRQGRLHQTHDGLCLGSGFQIGRIQLHRIVRDQKRGDCP